jgi:lipopolysaccharide transport system ATP-binding protein
MGDNDLAIKVESISKVFRLGTKEEARDNFATAFYDFVRSPLANLKKHRSLYKFSDAELAHEAAAGDILWALRDLSFDVKQGEALGIIGQNGAGKSTLLKILARITPPTKGEVRIRGRVSSLLEVGTGFHPELTGRENVYLNGTILGMRKAEVARKFDEIVEFSGVEKFLDTPVKRYSSGMRVRLAFAVAAHLEPEILIIDEVLAVGDVGFQKKCINKMQDVGQHGRTVLFVSHNMPAVTRLCQRALLLDGGRLAEDGPSDEVVSAYLRSGLGVSSSREWSDLAAAPGDEVVRLCGIRARTESGTVPDAFDVREPIGIELEFEVLEAGHRLIPYLDFMNDEGVKVFSAIDLDPEWRGRVRPAGRFISTAWIPGNLLCEGTIYVRTMMRTSNRRTRRFDLREAVAFNVIDSRDGESARGDWQGRLNGVVRPMLRWETQHQASGSHVR